MQMPLPLTRDLVLVGGGHTHALVLRMWGMRPLPGVRLTLVNPGPYAPYSGMLPGHVAGHYPREDLDIDLVRLARFAGARLVLGAATGIDRAAQAISVTGRAPISYDIASIDVGITSAMPGLPGFDSFGVPAKPLGDFATRWAAFVHKVTTGEVAPVVAVIGGGVAGVELAMAMSHRLRQTGVEAQVTLIEAQSVLSALRPRGQAILRARLEDLGVTLLEQRQISHLSDGLIHLTTGAPVSFGFCTGAAGTRPHPWLADTGLPATDGFLDVTEQLRSPGDPAIYAVGDCANMTFAPRPKAGVFAVRQAPILYHNLRADVTGTARRGYRPQRDYLKLISLGEKSALVEKGAITLASPWLWRLKDRIDQAFMGKFRSYPAMQIPDIPDIVANDVRAELDGGKPLCGGCGAKIGAGTLGAALAHLPAPVRKDVLSAPGDDAAILAIGGHLQVISTDHLRAVTGDPWTMAQIAAQHALGDIWAMGASPQAALTTLILPPMSAALQARTLREITIAASAVFRDAGAEIVGGHTTIGSELTIGFTVTGLANGTPSTLAGAQPGDVLILTKPVGAGTLLAAEMQAQAEGKWIAALHASLVLGQGPAAALLTPSAHAMTDVTGFGLAGHMLAMAEASGVTAVLDPDAVEFLAGAEALASQGVRSSLFAANRDHAAPRMSGFPPGPRTDLLFDPQTAGGLLAAIPPETADQLLGALTDAGYPARLIGTISAGQSGLRCGARTGTLGQAE